MWPDGALGGRAARTPQGADRFSSPLPPWPPLNPMSAVHPLELRFVRDDATARQMLAALADRAAVVEERADRACVEIHAGHRAFALKNLHLLLDEIADAHGVDDWSGHLAVQ